MNKQVLLFISCITSVALSAQSPWTRGKGGGFVQVAFQAIPTYGGVFEPSNGGSLLLDRKISENAIQVYGEYGIDHRTTLFGALPFRFLNNSDFISDNYAAPQTLEGRLSGIGNASIGIKRAILAGDFRLSGSLRIDAPAAAYDEGTGLRLGYDAWTFLPMLSIGKGYGKVYWFGYGGYGIRTSSYSHFFNAGAEVGIGLGKAWLIGFSELLYSTENGSIDLPLNNRITNLYVDRQGWWSVGLKAIVELNERFGVTASFAGAGWAQFVPKSPGISVGAYCKWD